MTKKVKYFQDESLSVLAKEINEFVCKMVEECGEEETFELVDVKFTSFTNGDIDYHYALVLYLEGYSPKATTTLESSN